MPDDLTARAERPSSRGMGSVTDALDCLNCNNENMVCDQDGVESPCDAVNEISCTGLDRRSCVECTP